MNVPEGLKYTTSHEWARVEEGTVVIGVTDYAQHELTDIVFIELPDPGREVKAGEACCVVESTKVASDIYAPVSGKILAVNEELTENPNLVNESPYEKGWLFKIEAADLGELEKLKSHSEYAELVAV
jgi:glycine cleavage system H protein